MVLLFLGVVGLEIKDVGDFVMLPAYVVVIATAVVGWFVAAHHRVRQGQKFAFIRKYEEELGLFGLKREILERADQQSGVAGRIFTARFIEIMHGAIASVAFVLLVRRIIGG